ncbi:MAG: peptide chain release factor N(5)-glutamine methyltransferase [Coriobacteriia bacterium]|nr:peptide chain release factor N(5)-glutamine methyltransferase [Coriobacteriia bacterium]
MGAERVWAVRDALDWTAEYFERTGVDNPRRSAEWLLSAATGLSRVELYAHFDRPLSESERSSYRASIERRAAGEPLQYVTGEMPFRHVVLKVRPGVFIPRPETEVLVDEVLAAIEGLTAPIVIDLCAGSGAIAISIAYERPDARVFATEIVPATADMARENAGRCGVADRVTVLTGDLFAPLPDELSGAVHVVASNPPYIPTADLADLPSEVGGFEPRVALDGGVDGLDVVRRIVDGAGGWLVAQGALVIETDTTRAQEAVNVMAAWYEGTRVVRDLAGRDRVATGRKRKD